MVARRGMPEGLRSRSTQLLGMVALQRALTSEDTLTQVGEG